MTRERAVELAEKWLATLRNTSGEVIRNTIKQAIIQACAEQREEDARICDTTAEFHGFYGTAAKDAAVKIRGQT